MFNSIGRLLLITALVGMLSYLGVLFVRRIGQTQEFQAPTHPWFGSQNWTVCAPKQAGVCEGQIPPVGTILELTLQPKGQDWEVVCAATSVSLKTFLTQTAHKDFLFNIRSTDTSALDRLVERVSHYENEHHFAAFANAQKSARYLRQKAPQWLFAADSATLLRLHVFTSLWLEPALDFWPDFVIASNDKKDGSRLTVREAAELHRRQKRVLWNESLANVGNGTPYAVEFPSDGVLTDCGLSALPK